MTASPPSVQPRLTDTPAQPGARPARSAVRPEIQALRALAVLLVVIFHLWPIRLPGGFIGVDVFFVISGYLITRHLQDEVERTGRVRVFQFWARRLRRLLPASLAVLAVTVIAVLVVVPFAFWSAFLDSIAAAALYVLNWRLAANAVDYWQQGAASSPVQHFWSLSAEEQFYFVWPLLITAVLLVVARLLPGRRPTKAIFTTLAVLFAASLAYSVVFTAASPGEAYFVTPTRAWEFAAGGLLAFAPAVLPLDRLRRSLVSWGGLALILGSAFAMSQALPFPGAIALIPVIGTIAMIIAGDPGGWYSPSGWMRLTPVQRVGDWSYSIYLWHWPLVILLPWLTGHPLTTIDKVVVIALTIGLAVLTQRFVEDPFRNAPFLKARRSFPTFAFSAAAMAVVVAVALGGMTVAGLRTSGALAQAREAAGSLPACLGAEAVVNSSCADKAPAGAVPAPAVARQDLDPAIEPCFSPDASSAVVRCAFGPTSSATTIALVGDSHGGVLASPLRAIAEKRGWHLDVFLKTGCPWNTAPRFRPDGNVAATQNCAAWQKAVTKRLEGGSYDLVVTTAYSLLAQLALPKDGSDAYATTVDSTRQVWSSFTSTTRTPIAVLRDNPDWDKPPADCLVGTPEAHPAGCVITRDFGFRYPDPQVDAARGLADVHLIDLSDVYCGATQCAPIIGGVTAYRDSNHLTHTFAMTLVPTLAKRLAALLG